MSQTFVGSAGDSLPPFASDEVRRKFASLKATERASQQAELQALELAERIKQMTEHLKSVSVEVEETQRLLDLERSEVTRQEHEKLLLLAEISKVRSDISELDKERKWLDDALVSVTTTSEQYSASIKEIQTKLKWSETELSNWVKAAKQKLEDEEVMIKYKHSDDIRIKDLRRNLEILTEQRTEIQHSLQENASETMSIQVELSRVQEQLLSSSNLRSQAIKDWERTLNLNQHRDTQIAELGEQYITAVKLLKQKQQEIDEQTKLVESLQSENDRKELLVVSTDKEINHLRAQAISTQDSLSEFRNTLDGARIELQAVATELQSKRKELKSITDDTQTKQQRLDIFSENLEIQNTKLSDLNDGKLDKEKLAKQAIARVEAGYRRIGELEKEKRDVINELATAERKLAEYRESEVRLLGEISGYITAAKNVTSQSQQFDHEIMRQQSMLYAADFETQLLQRKLGKLKGERSVEEQKDLEEQSRELEKQLEDQKKIFNALQSQDKKLDNDLKLAKRDLTNATKNFLILETTVRELDVTAEVSHRDHAILKKELDDKLIYRDSLKLDNIRNREELQKTIETAYEAEAQLEQLSVSVIEREQEMEAAREIIKNELRQFNEQKHGLAMKLAELTSKNSLLISKHQSLVKSRNAALGIEESSDTRQQSSQESQAMFFVKAAQRKEALQREGDLLDERIQKAEKELLALEKSLQYMRSSNQSYSDYLKKGYKQQANGKDDIDQAVNKLEGKIRILNDNIHKKVRAIEALERNPIDVTTLDTIKASVAQYEKRYEELLGLSRAMAKEISAQSVQASEAERLLRESGRVQSHADFISAISSDAQLQATVLVKAFEALTELAKADNDVDDFVKTRLQVEAATYGL